MVCFCLVFEGNFDLKIRYQYSKKDSISHFADLAHTYHMLGNVYTRLVRYKDAVVNYNKALVDAAKEEKKLFFWEQGNEVINSPLTILKIYKENNYKAQSYMNETLFLLRLFQVLAKKWNLLKN